MPKNGRKSGFIGLIKLLLGLALATLCAAAIPIYGLPFNGCNQYGYQAFDLHCSPWPEFARGFAFVAITSLATLGRSIGPLIALGLVLLVAAVGGIDLLRSQPGYSISLIGALMSGLFHGAVAAFMLYLAAVFFAKHRQAIA